MVARVWGGGTIELTMETLIVWWICPSLGQRLVRRQWVSYTCGGGRMEVTVEHGEVELLQPGAEAGQEVQVHTSLNTLLQ
jgi:hypothetical protein